MAEQRIEDGQIVAYSDERKAVIPLSEYAKLRFDRRRYQEALEEIAAWNADGALGRDLGYEGPRDLARKALNV